MSKEEKQKYLIENILSAGYDKTEFGHYMLSLKEDGTNIDNWALDELKNIVQNFIKIQSEAGSKKAKPSNETPNTTDTEDTIEKFFSDTKIKDMSIQKSNSNTNEAMNKLNEDIRSKNLEPVSKSPKANRKRDTMQVKAGASYLSLMDALFEADEEGKDIEYVHDDDELNHNQHKEEMVDKESFRRATTVNFNKDQLLDDTLKDGRKDNSKEHHLEEEKKGEIDDGGETIFKDINGFKVPNNILSKTK